MPSADALPLSRLSLIGNWTLRTYIEACLQTGEIRDPFGQEPTGYLFYTSSGRVSVHIMKPDRRHFSSDIWLDGSDEEFRESSSGYIAYAGTFEVDEQAGTVTHTVDVSLLPNWIGGRQVRRAKFLDGFLTLTSGEALRLDGMKVTATLVWERCS